MKTVFCAVLAAVLSISFAQADEVAERTQAVGLCTTAKCKEAVLLGRVRPRLIITCAGSFELSGPDIALRAQLEENFLACWEEIQKLPDGYLQKIGAL